MCLPSRLKRSYTQLSRRKASEKEDRNRAERWRETDCFRHHMHCSTNFVGNQESSLPLVCIAVCIGFLSFIKRFDDGEGEIVLWGYPDSVSIKRVLWIRRYTYLNELAARKVHIDSVASLCFVTNV